MKKLLLLSLISIFNSYSFAEDNSSIYRGLGTGPEDFLKFQTLKQKGFLAKKPNISRADYNDIYKLKKPYEFMGQNVVLISDEYMSEYVGCCVSEGWGAVFKQTTNLKLIEKFAKKNQCNIAPIETDSTYYGFKISSLPKGNYYELSCRERDLDESQ
ncbi:hypothetical protein [Acinetobacter baumannii]|uniref:hypothetical protein n=1 Tax=Acinetobacter baumannii TaxID=470 RepID=UPI0004501461|nr:hypothetical protein [Acinetobacter baumannii]EKX9887862.1 hypothetical protein [Acinetobacter baumannii]ELA9136073.1 hypothetical protein [Acinetobacter baumannii]ELW9269429.1 hypothetical protein [Acinetobacter baumannii]EXH48513.1 hypothetical protein J605_2255 [Acinetobacter baumannii 1412924]MDC4389465.1 hypothetical protein [Acinetobacter baumannii]